MTQHDFDIANAGGGAVRTDINNALGALVSLSSGTTAPTTTFPHMLWADSTNAVLKQRNAADTAWISLADLGAAYSQPGAQTIWVPAAAMISRSTSGAATGSTELATNKVMLATRDFDAAAAEYTQFSVGMPKGWNEGTITAEFIWTATSGTGTVRWAIQGIALSNDDIIDATWGTAATVDDALIAVNDLHVSAASSAVTIGGTPTEGDLVVFQFYRDAADAADTFDQDALLIGVRVKYTTNAGNDD